MMKQRLASSSPMQFFPLQTSQIMLLVILATLPAMLVATWFFGYGVILNVLFATLVGVLCEAAISRIRGHSVRATLADNSCLVTAVLFGMTIPPGTSWWLIVMGMVFAIALVKHAYGGVGQNTFNPAMAGYLFLLLAYPLDMTSWHLPAAAMNFNSASSPLGWQGFLQSLGCLFPFLPLLGDSLAVDGLAMATPLIESKLAAGNAIKAALEEGTGLFARSSETGWELINFAWLLGGLFLMVTRLISWHIPLSMIASTLIMSLLYYSPSAAAVLGTPYLQLFGSATMMGAFFIATDPVSAATGSRAKIAYGIIIGVSLYSIRVWGSYLDAVAIAVLFGNFCAPLLDRLLAPRKYGHPGLFSKLLCDITTGKSSP